MSVLPRLAHGFWLPLSFVAGWEVLARARLLDPLFFPPPTILAATAWAMILRGELPAQVQATLSRVALSALAGAASGMSMGILMGASSRVRRTLRPTIMALYSTPKVTLLPMLILLIGVGNAPGVIMVALSCFILMTMHTADAVLGVNRHYLEMAANYGASRGTILREVYFPSSLPQIFTGFRLSVGLALVLTIAVELVNSRDGIGSMLMVAWQTFAVEKIYVGVAVSGVIGLTTNVGLTLLERRLIRWRSSR